MLRGGRSTGSFTFLILKHHRLEVLELWVAQLRSQHALQRQSTMTLHLEAMSPYPLLALELLMVFFRQPLEFLLLILELLILKLGIINFKISFMFEKDNFKLENSS